MNAFFGKLGSYSFITATEFQKSLSVAVLPGLSQFNNVPILTFSWHDQLCINMHSEAIDDPLGSTEAEIQREYFLNIFS